MNSINTDYFRNIFRLAAADISKGMSDFYFPSTVRMWKILSTFFDRVEFSLLIIYYQYPIPILLEFARRYRDSALSPSKFQVCSRIVEGGIFHIGQKLSIQGPQDPHLIHQVRSNYTLL